MWTGLLFSGGLVLEPCTCAYLPSKLALERLWILLLYNMKKTPRCRQREVVHGNGDAEGLCGQEC